MLKQLYALVSFTECRHVCLCFGMVYGSTDTLDSVNVLSRSPGYQKRFSCFDEKQNEIYFLGLNIVLH